MNARGQRRRFDRFELDPERGTLLRDGRRVRIQPQPLRVLALLVERAGELVSREDLRQAIWGEVTFVEFDQGLNYCIRQIRQAMGDDAVKPVFIETLKKRGYIFIAPVEPLFAPIGAVSGAAPRPNVAADAPLGPAARPGLRLAIYAVFAVAILAAIAGRLVAQRAPPSP